jgi:hypothetical protein
VREKKIIFLFLPEHCSIPKLLKARDLESVEGIISEFSHSQEEENEGIWQEIGKSLLYPCTFTPNIIDPI